MIGSKKPEQVTSRTIATSSGPAKASASANRPPRPKPHQRPALVHSRCFTPRASHPGQCSIGAGVQYSIGADTTRATAWCTTASTACCAAKIISVEGQTIRLILFNNGDYRSFDPAKHLKPYDNWSEASVYELDLTARTVKKIWTYGKERGSSQHSNFVSNAIYIDAGATKTVAINFGGIDIDQRTGLNVGLDGDVDMPEFPDTEYFGKKRVKEHVIVMEVDYDTKEVLFECKVENNEGGPLTGYAYKMRKFPLY
jgi:hypothetical protein